MALVLIGIIILVALMIPIFGIVVDSPIGRAIARRLEGPEASAPPGVAELARKVELLEAEVDDLNRALEGVREETQFLQRLLEDQPRPPALPPRSSP